MYRFSHRRRGDLGWREVITAWLVVAVLSTLLLLFSVWGEQEAGPRATAPATAHTSLATEPAAPRRSFP